MKFTPILIEHLTKLSDFGANTNGRTSWCEPGTVSLVVSVVPQEHAIHTENCVITLLKQDGQLFTRPIYSFNGAIRDKWFRIVPSSNKTEKR